MRCSGFQPLVVGESERRMRQNLAVHITLKQVFVTQNKIPVPKAQKVSQNWLQNNGRQCRHRLWTKPFDVL